MTCEFLARLEAHIVERLGERNLPSLVDGIERRYSIVDAHTHTRIRSECDARLNVGGVESDFLVEDGIVVAAESLPVGEGLIPLLALGGIFATFNIVKCHLVGGNHATTCTHLDAEVAHRHSFLH